jgi:hypothetical protein
MQTNRLPLKQRINNTVFHLFVSTITSTPFLYLLTIAACIAVFVQPVTQDLLFQLKHRTSSLWNSLRLAREQKLNHLPTENPNQLLPPPMEDSNNDQQ